MKNWNAPALLMLCFLVQVPLTAQVSKALQNIEGSWYQDTRTAITYANWRKLGDQTLESQTFSIICGDTVMLSRALIQFTEETATLMVTSEGKSQQYRLAHFDNAHLIWENEHTNSTPKNLEWKFSSGGYAAFIADGAETTFRRDTGRPLKLKFRASLGANLNQYANPVSHQRFLAIRPSGNISGETQMLPGAEAAFSVGILFPSTPLCLNLEMGMIYRSVGVQASFYDQTNGIIERDGQYQNYNGYFSIVPEVFLGKSRNFSLSAGFYADVFQQRNFRGKTTSLKADTSKPLYSNPDFDIDLERGVMMGLHYRLASQKHLRPQMYLRYTHGLSNTQVRAISLGVAFEFEKQ